MLVLLIWFHNLASVFICNLQITHTTSLFLVQGFELIVLLLVLTHSEQERCVSLLLSHELLNDLTYIRVIGLIADGLEGLLDVSELSHFSAHAFLKECGPKSVDKQALSLLDFIGVLRLVGSALGDLSLTLGSCQTLLKSVLFVLDGGLEGGDTLLTLLLLVVDHLH